MSPLAALAFLPAWSFALAVAFVALRLGRERGRGLALLALTQSVWLTGLMLFGTSATRPFAGRVLPLGMLEAAAFLHATQDLAQLDGPRDRAVRVGAWVATTVVALLGVVAPGLLYGRGTFGPLFLPLAALATLASLSMWTWIARLSMVRRGAERRRLAWFGVGAVAGGLGGGGSLALFVWREELIWVAAPFMLIAIGAAAYASLDREEGRFRELLRAALAQAALTGLLSTVGLTLYVELLPSLLPAREPIAMRILWTMGISGFFAFALEPLRLWLAEALGRRMLARPIGVKDLALAALRQEERADQSERLAELGQVVSAVAHEIRNPLGVLLVQARLLEKAGAPEERVSAIREQVSRASRFVDELLRYGRPRPLDFRPHDVAALADQAAVQACLPYSKNDDAEERPLVRVERRGDCTGFVDRDALVDVLVALVDNALAALVDLPARQGPAGPREVLVTISSEDAEALNVAVDDDGPGVPEEIRDRLFEPFVTGRGRDATRPGTGLGLAIAHRTVSRHGGTLRYERSPRGGARFVLTLPKSATSLGAPKAARVLT
jgi:signal transduction histidine kinase